MNPFETHTVDNQPPEFAPRDLWMDDVALREAFVREGGGDFASQVARYGAVAGDALYRLSFDAHRDRPQQAVKAARRRSNKLEERVEELKRDRDLAQSLLMSAQKELVELWQEVQSLRAQVNGNIADIGSGSSGRDKKAS